MEFLPIFLASVLDPFLPTVKKTHIKELPGRKAQSSWLYQALKRGWAEWDRCEPVPREVGTSSRRMADGSHACASSKHPRSRDTIFSQFAHRCGPFVES